MALMKKGQVKNFQEKYPSELCPKIFKSLLEKFDQDIDGRFYSLGYDEPTKKYINLNETISISITLMDLYSRYYETIDKSFKNEFYRKIEAVYEYVVVEIKENGFYMPIKSTEARNQDLYIEYSKVFSKSEESHTYNYTLYNALSFLIAYVFSYHNDSMVNMINKEGSDLFRYNSMFNKLQAQTETQTQNLLRVWLEEVKKSAIKDRFGDYCGFGVFGKSEKVNIYFTYLFAELLSDLGDNVLGEYYTRYQEYYDAIPNELVLEIGKIRKQISTNYERQYFAIPSPVICTNNIFMDVINNIFVLLTMVLSNSEFETDEFCQGIDENGHVLFDHEKNIFLYSGNDDFQMKDNYIKVFEAGISYSKIQLLAMSGSKDNYLIEFRVEDIPKELSKYRSIIIDNTIKEGNILSFSSRLLILNTYYVSMTRDTSVIELFNDVFNTNFYNKEQYLWSWDKFNIMSTKRNLEFINDFDDYISDFSITNDNISADKSDSNLEIYQKFNLEDYISGIVEKRMDVLKSEIEVKGIGDGVSIAQNESIVQVKNIIESKSDTINIEELNSFMNNIIGKKVNGDHESSLFIENLQRLVTMAFCKPLINEMGIIDDSEIDIKTNKVIQRIESDIKDILIEINVKDIENEKTS